MVKGPVPAEHKVLQDIFDTLVQNCHARANNAVSLLPLTLLQIRRAIQIIFFIFLHENISRVERKTIVTQTYF